jgi:hypothetical protein
MARLPLADCQLLATLHACYDDCVFSPTLLRRRQAQFFACFSVFAIDVWNFPHACNFCRYESKLAMNESLARNLYASSLTSASPCHIFNHDTLKKNFEPLLPTMLSDVNQSS